jgi:hypothetical protein
VLTAGAVHKTLENDKLVVFVVRDREENGHLDPDPVEVRLTPDDILNLKPITMQEIADDKKNDYVIFSVLGKQICWQKHSVFEGAFAGTIISFYGPFLICDVSTTPVVSGH